MSHEVPSRHWERVGTDIFTLDGKNYLVTIDYYSNFWEVDRLPDTKASIAILKLKSHFTRYGIPDQVVMGRSSLQKSLRHSRRPETLST